MLDGSTETLDTSFAFLREARKCKRASGFTVLGALGIFGAQNSNGSRCWAEIRLLPLPEFQAVVSSTSSIGMAFRPRSTAILKLVPRTAFRVPARTW